MILVAWKSTLENALFFTRPIGVSTDHMVYFMDSIVALFFSRCSVMFVLYSPLTETKVNIRESIRGKDVYIVQTGTK